MARPVIDLPKQNLQFRSTPFSLFFALIAVLSVFSLVTFLCASHRRAKNSLKAEKEGMSSQPSNEMRLLTKLNSNISGKAHHLVKLISWKKVQVEDEDDDAVWRRTIMRGEKCRPLDFSGKIEYDSEGNLLPDS
ncbi:hypothetical protein AB3S75_029857 [Citrus x aurantiifolia]